MASIDATSTKRSPVEVARDMLILCNGRAVGKTQLMREANVSYTAFRSYSETLLEKGFIEIGTDGKWIITKTGREFLAIKTELDALWFSKGVQA